MSKREREVKLLAASRAEIDRISERNSLADCALSPAAGKTQVDTYLDAEGFRLFRAGLALRVRRKGGTAKVTLKEIGTRSGLLTDRKEIEEPGESPEFGGEIARSIDPVLDGAPVRPLLRIRTERRKLVLGDGLAELCLDAAVVLPPEGDTVAATFFEVEVEDKAGDPDRVVAAGRELLEAFDLSPSDLSKFERGLQALGLLEAARGGDREAP